MTVELHTLTGAYAAHALSAEEQAEFEAHLAECPECRQETRELVATTARIGAAESVPPPSAELKARILAEVARTRQQPPVRGHRVVDLADRRPRRMTLMVAASVAALAIVGGGVAGGVALHERSRTQQVQADQASVSRVLAAADARTLSAVGAGGMHGTAVVSDAQHAAVFSAASWPAAPSGKVYELWVMDASGARKAALLDRRSDGSVAAVVAKDLPTSQVQLGITVEPAGGSSQPTTAPVMLLDVNA